MIRQLVSGRVALVAVLGLTVALPAWSAAPLPAALSKALAPATPHVTLSPDCQVGGIYYTHGPMTIDGCHTAHDNAAVDGQTRLVSALYVQLRSLYAGWQQCLAYAPGTRKALIDQPDFPRQHALATEHAFAEAVGIYETLLHDYEMPMGIYQQKLIDYTKAIGAVYQAVINDGCIPAGIGDIDLSKETPGFTESEEEQALKGKDK